MKLRRHLLHLAHGAQVISSRNLEYVVIGISSAQKLGEEVRIAGNVFQTDYHRAWNDIVEVGANTDVIDARHFANVVDVVCYIGYAAARRDVFLIPVGKAFRNRLVGTEAGVQVLERSRTFLLPLRVTR